MRGAAPRRTRGDSGERGRDPIGPPDGGPARAFVAHDERFRAVTGPAPRLERLARTDAHEGAVYRRADDALYFATLPVPTADPRTGVPVNAVARLTLGAVPALSVVARPCNGANGMALAPDGRLLVCEQGTRTERARISLLEPATGRTETVVDRWAGLRFNSPNDVAVARDGAVWFTDPSYGHLQGFKPEPLVGDFVYRHDPATGRVRVVADDFDKPNGLAFSPDGSVLYICDSGANQELGSFHVRRPHHVRAFDVVRGCLVGGRLFAVVSPGIPDGIAVDDAGRVYVCAADGVQVFDHDGGPLGTVRVAGAVSLCFGGRDRNVLFVLADTAIWAATLHVTG